MDILWSQVESSAYREGLPKVPPWRASYSTIECSPIVNASFDVVVFDYGDEMPPGRLRILSPFGSVAKVQLEIFPNSSHYTGVFKSGGTGLVRLSDQQYESYVAFNPSFTMKILLDGVPSVNFHGMFRPNVGQDNDTNVFKNPMSNIVSLTLGGPKTPNGKGFRGSLLLLPGKPNDQPESIANMGLYEHASVTAPAGTPVNGQVVAPFQITFRPNPDITWNGSDTTIDYRQRLSLIPPNTVLYTVTVTRRPNSTEHDFIGQLITRSHFVASKYGDEKLAFRHASKRWQPPQNFTTVLSRNAGDKRDQHFQTILIFSFCAIAIVQLSLPVQFRH
ncbi:hypothetical protein BV898_07744 [Hypsibius exemplaris]|uniref:Uncharacterized protein n=1 Tax=Hypsibius exemplaris TaxID=2072580 RepID=A0A1W0WSI8_HYPEX|nr:hypothetical protein BV898_07744 [Hypsibius exemplaris]